MEQKLAPQEAALYFGQEVFSEATTDSYGKLIGIEHVGQAITWQVERKDGTHFWVSAKNLTHLLLRPLAAITEEEAKQVCKLEIGYVQTRIDCRSWAVYIEKTTCKPKTFAYLLSKGFDLFNWIEQGKALDKTKLPATT